MHVAVLLFHEVGELEALLPYGLLARARRALGDPPAFELSTIAKSRNSVQTAGGLTITPHWAFMSAPELDTLILPGGPGVERVLKERTLKLYWQTRQQAIRRVITIGSGVLIAGELGLLRDQQVAAPRELAERVEGYEVACLSSGIAQNPRLWCAATAGEVQALMQAAFPELDLAALLT